jgi:hypothetical protein
MQAPLAGLSFGTSSQRARLIRRMDSSGSRLGESLKDFVQGLITPGDIDRTVLAEGRR